MVDKGGGSNSGWIIIPVIVLLLALVWPIGVVAFSVFLGFGSKSGGKIVKSMKSLGWLILLVTFTWPIGALGFSLLGFALTSYR